MLRMSFDDLELHIVWSQHESGPQAVRPARRRQYFYAFLAKSGRRLIQVVHADRDMVDRAAAIGRVLRASLPLPAVECFRVRGRIPEERDVIELR